MSLFYSQELMKQRIENFCIRCERRFERWSDYHFHVMTVECVSPKQPMAVSGKRNLVGVKQPLSDERKAEIVQAWEDKHKGVVI